MVKQMKQMVQLHPWLDRFLMGLISLELALTIYTLRNEPQMLVLFALLLGVVAVAVKTTRFVFRTSGYWISAKYLQHLGNPLKKAITMKKWCDQSWQLVIHFSMAVFEYAVLRDEKWWDDTTTLWNQGTDTGVFPEQKFLTKLLYVTQLAIWFYTAFSCKFLEEVRRDYLVMMSHHVVTIALVVWSYAVGFLPVGVVVLFLHDVSDVPLDALKMINYLKLEGKKGMFLCEVSFVVLLADWVYFRLYLYPTKLLYTTLVENREASMPYDQAHDWSILFPNPGPPSWLLFNILLISLYCLHIWWGYLLFRILIGIVTKGAHQSGKDHYEGSSDDERER